jgi:hypothetical protein
MTNTEFYNSLAEELKSVFSIFVNCSEGTIDAQSAFGELQELATCEETEMLLMGEGK